MRQSRCQSSLVIRFRVCLYGVLLLSSNVSAAASEWSGSVLSLEQAEQLAINNDPVIAAGLARANAATQNGIADAQLPDPTLKFGLFNLPLDSFDLEEQPTTQLRMGVQQAIPRGNTLRAKQAKADALANIALASSDLRKRQTLRDVREVWFELYYQLSALQIITENRGLFSQLVDITESQYASGRISQQDVLRAQLELSRLDDRATRIQNREAKQRAALGKWIGTAAQWQLPETMAEVSFLPTEKEISVQLEQHPGIVAEGARILAANHAADIARAQYKLGWNVGLEYRKRFGESVDGSDRADMMAIMATVDLPLFAARRQDKRVSASLQQVQAATLMREEAMRKLAEVLEREYSNWRLLGERQTLYETRLFRDAEANARASVSAYQSGVGEFTALMRARMTALDVRLESLRIRIDRAKAHARLRYLASGEKK